jgi:hypothetical protein
MSEMIRKWYHPLRQKADQKISALYETAGLPDYQVISKGIVVECWPVYRKADQKPTSVIVTMHKQTGFVFIYEHQF